MIITEPNIETLAIADRKMRFLDYRGEGPAMFFVHATGFIPWLWHPIARCFAGEFRIIAPFLYEHRFTPPEEGGVDWKLLADDLGLLCGALNLRGHVLVGHSIGATLAALVAAMPGSHPKKMILFEPIFLPEHFYGINPTIEQHPMASKAVKRGNYWENPEQATAYFRARDLFKNWDDEMMEIYVHRGLATAAGGGLTLVCTPRQEAALYMGDTRYNPWPHLGDVECPVLVVEGEKSEIGELIDCKKAASSFPMGSHRMVREAGHLIPMEKPGETVLIIKEFLSER